MENIIHDDNDIEDYYKNIDKPIINNCINNLNLKNLLKLSTVVDLYLFTKKKNKKMSRKINTYDENQGIKYADFPISTEYNQSNILQKQHITTEPSVLDRICQEEILSDKSIIMNPIQQHFPDPHINNNQKIKLDYSEKNNKIIGGSTSVNIVQNEEIQTKSLHKSSQFNKGINNNKEFQMDQFTWKLKDKRELLKECEFKRKKIIKEASSSLNILSKAEKSSKLVNEIKIKNNNLLNNVENIDSIIETIENNFPTVVDEFIEIYSN